jgi:hypothetical protein
LASVSVAKQGRLKLTAYGLQLPAQQEQNVIAKFRSRRGLDGGYVSSANQSGWSLAIFARRLL